MSACTDNTYDGNEETCTKYTGCSAPSNSGDKCVCGKPDFTNSPNNDGTCACRIGYILDGNECVLDRCGNTNYTGDESVCTNHEGCIAPGTPGKCICNADKFFEMNSLGSCICKEGYRL